MPTILYHPAWKEQGLTDQEKEYPHTVIEQFFDFAHLPEIKEMLRDIFQMMVNKNYAYQPGTNQHDDMVYFFEKMEKLVEAIYILHIRETAGR